jgi:flagellar hook-length control protein FliK
MIEVSTSRKPQTAAPPNTSASSAKAGGFALTLEAFLDASAPPEGPATPAVTGRQGDAEGGKIVPQDTVPDQDPDRNGASQDPALVWLPGLTAPAAMPAVASTPALETGGSQPAPAHAVATMNPPLGAPVAQPGKPPGDTPPPPGIAGNAATPASPTPTPMPIPTPTPIPTPADFAIAPVTILSTGKTAEASEGPDIEVDAPAPRLLLSAAAPIVALAPMRANAAGTVQPARQAFAAAIDAFAVAPRKSRPRSGDDGATGPLISIDGAQTTTASAIKATGDAQQTPLDLRQDRGIAQMIDHIEALRDDANANETRVRLVPDALGTIDVAVSKQGDAVHVHFTSRSDATRAAIADAQPRLTEMAETRGLRIAGTSIDSGGSRGGNANPQPRPDSARPAPAASARAANDTIIDGQRLA